MNQITAIHYFLSATSFLYYVGVLPMMKCATFTLCTIWKPSMLSHIWPARRMQTLKCSEIFHRRQIFLFQWGLMCWRCCMDIMKVKNSCNPFYSCHPMLTDVFLYVGMQNFYKEVMRFCIKFKLLINKVSWDSTVAFGGNVCHSLLSVSFSCCLPISSILFTAVWPVCPKDWLLFFFYAKIYINSLLMSAFYFLQNWIITLPQFSRSHCYIMEGIKFLYWAVVGIWIAATVLSRGNLTDVSV